MNELSTFILNLHRDVLRSQPHSSSLSFFCYCVNGSAVGQVVSRWLPTAAARVRARVCSNGICGGQSGAGAGFLRVLRSLLPIIIPPNSPSSQSPGARTIGQKWPTCRVDPVWTPPLTMLNYCVNSFRIVSR
jgi:hypothetical protein